MPILMPYSIPISFSNNTNRALLAAILMSISLLCNAGWEVHWIDKFEGEEVNWDNWTAQTQANYNNEIQCYTDDETTENRNYEVSNGTLKIIARKMDIDCPGLKSEARTWTSGRLNSKDKAEFQYGRIETRLRFNQLKGGVWPAFWMLEHRIDEQPIKGDNDNIGWPNPGAAEIDVWEWYSNDGDRYITNFFNNTKRSVFRSKKCGYEQRIDYPNGANDVTKFNVYAMEWTPDSAKFYMNNMLVAERDLTECPDYEIPMFVLLNVAIGGTLGGKLDPTLDMAQLEVDYVAHCKSTATTKSTGCNESTPVAQ